MKKPFISNTIRKIAFFNAAVMFGLYLTFTIFTLFILNYVLIDDLDTRLRHELDHLLHTVDITVDSLIINSTAEIEEADFQKITETPFFLQIYNLEGVLYYKSKNLDEYEEILLGFPNKFTPYFFESFNSSKDELRTIYKELFDSNKNHVGYIQLSTIHTSFNEVVKNVFWFNIFTMPIVLFIITFLSVFLAKKSYQPINNIIDLAKKISATNLSQRLETAEDPNDELAKLIETLNSLFERLEKQINEISHFTDNASHQLMTPLTAIKTELDYILKKERNLSQYQESGTILKEQVDKMITLIKTMLLLAKDCEECLDNKNVFNLSHLVQNEIVASYKISNVTFDVDHDIYLRGKSEYFSIVLQNLINNAQKYSLQNEEVSVIVKKSEKSVSIIVADRGIGITDDEKEKIFDRFYRVENKKSSKVVGYGLGLSLAKSVTNRMGGNITVEDNMPSGAKFIIILPLLNLDYS